MAAEEERVRKGLEEARRRLTQLRVDLGHAEQLRSDAVAAEARLGSEESVHAAADSTYPGLASAAEADFIEAADLAREAEQAANRATEAAAEANAQAQSAVVAFWTQAEQRAGGG